MNKSLIRKRFEKGLSTYDENAVVQKIMAKNLVELLGAVEFKNILELGCGTGVLTKEVTDNIRFEKYIAVDIVEGCDKYIKEISSEVKFIAEDIENFSTDEKFDLIISNASFQWLDNLPLFLKRVKNLLSDNGVFAFTVFGKDNYSEMSDFVEKIPEYYSREELKKMLPDFKKSEIKENKQVLEFSTPTEVLYHIKNTGVNALSQTRWTKSDLLNFEKNYPKNPNGMYRLTYHPIYVIADKLL